MEHEFLETFEAFILKDGAMLDKEEIYVLFLKLPSKNNKLLRITH